MKKILITLDFDPSAQKVAEKGYSIAKTMRAEITLFHVLADPEEYLSNKPVTVMGFAGHLNSNKEFSKEKSNFMKLAQQFLEKSKLYLGDNRIQTLIGEGDCSEEILTAANRIAAEVIVMGSHGHKRFENKTMGRVTEKVLQNTTIPVLIVPTKNHGKS